MVKHIYPVIPTIGYKVGKTFKTSFNHFGRDWKFNVRSQSEANIAKSCLVYYKAMWEGKLFEPIGKKDLVVDIGAHVGFFAVPVSTIVKRVIAFEPSPANYQLLVRNNKLNKGNIHLVESAVGRDTGITTLYMGVQGTTGHSTTSIKRGGVSKRVLSTTIAEVIGQYNPTILKLDCEGAEWDILATSFPVHLWNNVRVIIAEMHKVKQNNLPKIVKNLKMDGFKVKTHPNSWFTKLIAYKE
jgi:FkbM family methyltransferase